mgnify:CR=1 FL=1
MRRFGPALLALSVICSGSVACAQYGLYGSPETLPVAAQSATPTYTAASAYPTTGAPAAYATQPQYRYPAQGTVYQSPYQGYPAGAAYPTGYPQTRGYQPAAGSYRYPAQTPATAMYQPYQPGSQYRYPAPSSYSRMGGRTAAVASAAQVPAVPAPAGVVPAPAPVAGGEYSPIVSEPVPQGPNLMNQMMSDQCGWGNGYGGGCYGGGCGQPGYGQCGEMCEMGCGDCCPWYASISALVMGRSGSRRLWTSYATNDETNQLTNSDFGMQWAWGGEATFGRRFCCDCVPYAIQATYWTTEQMSGERITTNPGNYVSTPLIVTPMTFGGVSAQNWFDGAQEHRLSRWDEFHNVEVNLVREQLAWACDSHWDIGWSVGIRYFRFAENLTFASVRQGAVWGDLADMAYFSDTISNNLIGPQFGFNAAYCVGSGVRLFISPQVGIYGNFLESDFAAHTGDGVNGVGPYGSFPVHSTRTGLSFLTQIDTGVDWQLTRNWSARAGYRVVAITGMGLADDQFPQYMVDTPDIADIQHTSSLVLHGAFFGVTYNF